MPDPNTAVTGADERAQAPKASSSVRVAARDLERCVAATFRAAGATGADAECVASALVASDLAGHASHGIIRAPSYLEAIDQGTIDLRARPELTGEDGATARVDGHDGFGQIAGRFAMEVAIRKAREHGVSSVALVRTTHVGRLGDYVELAADAGMVGLAFCTATSAAGRVAPFGSVEPVFGTNPFAAAIPSADGRTVLCDFATSVVAEGKLQIAVNKGESVPEGWLLSPDGQPTTDPSDHYAGGPLLAFGGYKGSGLAIVTDLLAGVLAGKGTRALPGLVAGNGVLFIVIDIRRLHPLDEVLAGVAAHSGMIRSAAPAPGVDAVMVPGDPERRAAAENERRGVPIDQATWRALTEAMASRSVAPPPCMADPDDP